MKISVGETTTEVTVKAFTMLRVDRVVLPVKERTARIDHAEVYWVWEDDAWRINFIQLTGSFLKKDGTVSRQPLDLTTRPDEGASGRVGEITPPQIVEAARFCTPDWTPEVSESPLPARSRGVFSRLRRKGSSGADRPGQSDRPEQSDRPGLEVSARAGITHVETTTQVLVRAFTTLRPEDFTAQVKARTARIDKATVHWGYRDGAWVLDAVDLWGPVIRQSDGSESNQHVDELTHPASAPNGQ